MTVSTNGATLEARALDLLLPYHSECSEPPFPVDDFEKCSAAATKERKAMILTREYYLSVPWMIKAKRTKQLTEPSGNLAFLVSNHFFKTEKSRRQKLAAAPEICPSDVLMTVTRCKGGAVAEERGVVNVAVRYPAAMQSVVRVILHPSDNVIDELYMRVEKTLKATVV